MMSTIGAMEGPPPRTAAVTPYAANCAMGWGREFCARLGANAPRNAAAARSNRAPAWRGHLRLRLPEAKAKGMKKLCIKTPATMGGWELNPTLPPLDVKVNAQIQRFTTEINAPISGSSKTTAGNSRRRFSGNSRLGDGRRRPHFQRGSWPAEVKEAPARIQGTQARRLPSAPVWGETGGLGFNVPSRAPARRRIRPVSGILD